MAHILADVVPKNRRHRKFRITLTEYRYMKHQTGIVSRDSRDQQADEDYVSVQ